jgi:hypothetical protein
MKSVLPSKQVRDCGHSRSDIDRPCVVANTMRTQQVSSTALAFVVLGLLCMEEAVLGFDFEARGRCSFENFNPDGSPLRRFDGEFTVQRYNGKWRILHAPDKSPVAMESVFDGEDVYTLTRNLAIHPQELKRMGPAGNRYSPSNGVAFATTASISSGEYPFSAPAIQNRFIWFGLLSGPLLRRNADAGFPAPWGLASSPESRAFVLTAEWPAEDSLFFSRVRFHGSRKMWHGAVDEHLFPHTFDPADFELDSQTSAIYQVTAWTNVTWGGKVFQFPLGCRLDRYYPSQKGQEPMTKERYSLQITKAQPYSGSIELPQIHEPVVDVTDARFQDSVHPGLVIAYSLTGRVFRSKSEIASSAIVGIRREEYRQLKTVTNVPARRALHEAPMSPRKQRSLLAILIGLCIGPPLLWAWSRRRLSVKQ